MIRPRQMELQGPTQADRLLDEPKFAREAKRGTMELHLVDDFARRVVWMADNVGYVDAFLSPDDIALLLGELKYAYWRPSPTYVAMPNGTRLDIVNGFRKSESAYYHWFTPKMLERLQRVDRELSEAFTFDIANIEPWQATRYGVGGNFEYHRDSGYWGDHPAGERITTFLLHVKSPAAGGATSFRALDLEVPAVPGRLVFWLNHHPDGATDYRMIHSGAPVLDGTKMTLASWQRQYPFPRNLINVEP